MRKRLVVTVFLVLAATAPTAQAVVKAKIAPNRPIVDDAVTLSWKTDRKLKRGEQYRATLLGPFGNDCATFVYKESRRRPRKGARMSFRFSPYNDRLNGGPEWCRGKAYVSISVAKRSSPRGSGKIIDIMIFRFRGKP